MSKHLEKFVLNRAGVAELLKGQAMQNVLIEYAGQVAKRAGDGYDVYVGRNRANVSVAVTTTTEEAYQDNLDNNTIEKALRS